MNRNKIVVIAVVIAIPIAGGVAWKIMKKIQMDNAMVKLRSGEIVHMYPKHEMTKKEKKNAVRVDITGKIEEVSNNVSGLNTTRIVLITDTAEMIILLNPPYVNGLRYNGVGKIYRLQGFWNDPLPFRGRYFKAFWIEYAFPYFEEKVSVKASSKKKAGKAK